MQTNTSIFTNCCVAIVFDSVILLRNYISLQFNQNPCCENSIQLFRCLGREKKLMSGILTWVLLEPWIEHGTFCVWSRHPNQLDHSSYSTPCLLRDEFVVYIVQKLKSDENHTTYQVIFQDEGFLTAHGVHRDRRSIFFSSICHRHRSHKTMADHNEPEMNAAYFVLIYESTTPNSDIGNAKSENARKLWCKETVMNGVLNKQCTQLSLGNRLWKLCAQQTQWIRLVWRFLLQQMSSM